MKRIIVFILVLFLLSGGLCYAGSSLNGTWKFKTRLCMYYNDELYDCEKGNSKYTVSNNKLYYSGSKVGTAKKSGKKVIFEYDSDYMKTSFEVLFQYYGIDVTVEEITLSFYGTLRNNTIKNGKIKGKMVMVFNSTGGTPTPPPPRRIKPLEAELSATPQPGVTPEQGKTYTFEFSGKFTAEKQKRKGRSLKELHNREGDYGDVIDVFDIVTSLASSKLLLINKISH